MLPESVSEQCEDAQLCFGSRKVVREGCLRVLPSLSEPSFENGLELFVLEVSEQP